MRLFIIAILSSLVARLFIGAGLSFVAYKGFDVLIARVVSTIKSAASSNGVDVAVGLIASMGFFDALGVVLGAYVAAAGIVVLKSAISFKIPGS